MASTLGTWLAGLPADRLAEILTRRPDALAQPVPGTLRELADRLQSRPSVGAAFHGLPLPAVQVIEALQSFGPPAVVRDQLAALLGRDGDDAELTATLDTLAMRALVWPDGRELRMTEPLWSAFEHPLQLGPPAGRLLAARTADELRRIAAALGVPVGRNKQQVVADLVAALADGEPVRAALRRAPAHVREDLHEIARHGPVVRHEQIIYGYGHSANPSIDWALSRGLLVADGWQAAVMPGEVGLAIRGPQWRAEFTPRPPVPPLADASPAAVAREAAAAAGAAVSGVTALLEVCAASPPALLKAGGVGARELRRLGRAVGADDPVVRLWLELAYAAGLVGIAEKAVLPTQEYDAWREHEPAQRLVPLLTQWWRLPAAPLAASSPAGEAPPAALSRTPFGDLIRDVRQELLRTAADLPPGRGVTAEAALVEPLSWRAPLLIDTLDEPADLPTAAWREARLLGLVAHGALTPLGRALLEDAEGPPDPTTGADPAVARVAGELLPAAVATALFQADLTAVVPGTPTAALAALLDSAADRESRGGASTWRFSPASVRRALDAGTDAGTLLASLTAAAVGAALPQPLGYLVGDVARRHGQVRVRPVACVIRGEDPALLAEIVAVRSLAPLRLVLLAPTVVGSGKPVAETLAALRAAGYAPVGEADDGSPLVERQPQRRATAKRRTPPVPARRTAPAKARRGGGAKPDGTRSTAAGTRAGPGELARALLAGPVPTDAEPEPARVSAGARGRTVARPDPDDTQSVVTAFAPQLSAGERRLLTHAIDHGLPVKIKYTNAQGNASTRVIEPLEVYGRVVEAWCHLREEERMFALDRIDAVAPA